jgi:hypothetical protein
MRIRRGIAELLACVATSAMILVATPLSAGADDLLDDHQHMPLINIGSGKCFEPIGGSSAGLPIQQRTCSPGVMRPGTIDRTIQYYQFQHQDVFNEQGWFCRFFGCINMPITGYLIRNLDTNLCLNVRNGSKSGSAVVQQSTCNKNTRSMLWHVQPGDWPGVFKVRNFNSELCLDVRGGSRDEDAQLQQFHCTSLNLAQNFSQKFLELRMNLNGRWTDGSTENGTIRCCVVISSGAFGHIFIDMSAFNRRAARGWYLLTPWDITVNFPDDRTFTGVVSPWHVTPTRISWSNGSVWTRR